MSKKKKDKKKYEIIKTVFIHHMKSSNSSYGESKFLKDVEYELSDILNSDKNTKLINVQQIFDTRTGYCSECFATFCKTEKIKIYPKKKEKENIDEPNKNN